MYRNIAEIITVLIGMIGVAITILAGSYMSIPN